MVNHDQSAERDRVQKISATVSPNDFPKAAFSERRELPCTLSPRFAFTVVVQWRPGATLDDAILKSKMDQVKYRAFTVAPKNVYGLEGGAVFCYWENVKNQHADLMKAYLSKKATQDRMTELNVLSITFHESCRVRLSAEPFQSRVLDGGKVTTYRFKTASAQDAHPPATPVVRNVTKPYDKSEPSSSAKPGPVNEAHHGAPTSQALSNRISQRTEFQRCLFSDDAKLQDRNNPDERVPPRGPRAERVQKQYHSGPSAPSPSVASSSILQKRPRSSPDTDQNGVGGKRSRNAISSLDNNVTSLKHIQSDLSQPLQNSHEFPNTRSTSWKNREDLRVGNRTATQVHVDMELECERARSVEKYALGRNDELEDSVDKLRGRVRELQGLYEASKKQVSSLRETLEEAESAKKALGESLQAAQKDRQELQLREAELQQALHGVLHDLEEARRSGSKAEQELSREKSLAVEARIKAEEDKNDMMDKLRSAEKALAAEQLQRRAAEETFLDVKCVLSGVDVFRKDCE